MARSRRGVARTVAGVLLVPGSLMLAAGPAAATVTEVSGGAFGESVDVTLTPPLLPATNVMSGPLPSVTLPATGGNESASALSANAPGVLTAGVLNVSTQGTTGPGGTATSSASVADANVLNAISATLISSTCTANESGVTGSTTLVNAVLADGTVVSGTPGPNTEFTLLGGDIRVILNEQIVTDEPGYDAITVNAVHVIFSGDLVQGDVILAQSHCDVRADGGPTPVIPESPLTVLLPLTTLALLGGGVLVLRRRHPTLPA